MRISVITSVVISVALLASGANAQTTQPTTKPAIAPADQVLKQLLKPSTPAAQVLQPIQDAPTVDSSSGANAVAPGARDIKLVREGTYVVDRIGRLTRVSEGQMEFTYEADGKNMQDPPMLILPNLMLMSMETAVNSSNRDMKFRVTGMVTEYRGRNCILLEKVVPVRDGASQF